MEKVRSWCGQPSYRGWLKNRTEWFGYRVMVTVRVRVRYDILTERLRDRVVPVFIRVTSSASVTTVYCAVTLKYLLTSVTLMDIRATTTTTRGRPISIVGAMF